MSENNEGDDNVRKGNEWEVVALTGSTYAAAPGPNQDILDNSYSNVSGDDNAGTAGAIFMSGHFGFASSINENLPLGPEYKEEHCRKGLDYDVPQLMVRQGGKSDLKHEEDLHIEGLSSDEFPVRQLDEKVNPVSFCSEIGDAASSKLIDEEQSMYCMGSPGFYDDDAALGMPCMTNKGSESTEPYKDAVHPDMSNVQKLIEEPKSNELPDRPCEVWWRRHAASLYGHLKNANPYWSVIVAAAVMGILIIGHRWERDKPQVFQLKSQLFINNGGSGWVLSPVTQLRDASLGGQHSSYIRISSLKVNQ